MPFRKHGWMRPFQRRTSTPKRRCCISCAFRHGGRVERAKKIVKLRRLGLSAHFPEPESDDKLWHVCEEGVLMPSPCLAFCPYLPMEEPIEFGDWELGPACRVRRTLGGSGFQDTSQGVPCKVC